MHTQPLPPPYSHHPGASAYAKVGAESAAMSASPHQLITMLFDAAKTAIAMARYHMANKDISAKGQAISKAINIVDNGLKASLDADAAGVAGAQLVADLSAFYAYVAAPAVCQPAQRPGAAGRGRPPAGQREFGLARDRSPAAAGSAAGALVVLFARLARRVAPVHGSLRPWDHKAKSCTAMSRSPR